MKEKSKARNMWLVCVLLLYGGVADIRGKQHGSGPELTDEAHVSSDGIKGGMDLTITELPKANYTAFLLQPSPNEETVQEVVDEDEKQSSDADIGPAEPVSDSLVEIVQENDSKTPQKGRSSKPPLKTRISSLSSLTSKFPKHKELTLQQSLHRKPRVKLKWKFAKGQRPSESKIATRVSIPGKHRLFNISHLWSNWMKLLSSRKFSSLRRHNTFRGSALQLNNNRNQKDEGKKRISQMSHNQGSSRDALDAFISQMGLNESSNLDYKNSLRKQISHFSPENNVSSSKENTDLSPRNDSLQMKSTNRTNVIMGKPKSISFSPQVPIILKGVPLVKKAENSTQVETEVFNRLPDTKVQNGEKHLTSKGRQWSIHTSTNVNILPSSSLMSNKINNSFGDVVSGRMESGPGKENITAASQVSAKGLNIHKEVESDTTRTPQLKINENLNKSGIIHNSSQSRTTNNKSFPNQIKNESDNLAVVNNTMPFTEPNYTFALPLNSSITKHFNDLINFFNSLESSSSKNSTTSKGNSTSQKLLRLLDLIHIRKANANYTTNKEGYTHSNPSSNAEQNRKRLQMSIYKGWNEVGKAGRPDESKRLPLPNLSMRKEHADPNHAWGFEINGNSKKSKAKTFELDVLRMMNNVSKKELLKLEGEIQDMLSPARLLNLSQQNEKEIPRQHGISLKKLEERHQQHFEVKSNETKLHHHQLELGSKEIHFQENNKSRHFLEKMNVSTNSTTVRNSGCTLKLPLTNKHIDYGCYHKNASIVSFQDSLNTSTKAETGKFNKTDFHSTFVTSPSIDHFPATKMTKLNITWPSKTGNSNVTTNPNFNASKEIDDIKNISIQLDRDAYQDVDAESISEEKMGSGDEGFTELETVEHDKTNSTTKWSEWTPCSKTCGRDSKRKRTQFRCTSSSQEIKDCVVSGKQNETCAFKPCPVNGQFLSWSSWSSCSRSCGFNGFSVRTRSCQPPKHGGQSCYGSTIDTKKCNRKHCPVNGGFSQWSKFGLCSKSCGGGVKMRKRECNNPVPRYGGVECSTEDLFETESCGNMKCPAKTLKRPQVADVDPKSLCDFNPCEEARCIHDPAARCITDFECNPVFFDTNGDMLPQCKGIDNLYSRIPQVICSYNPCLSEKCWDIRNQCVVDLKCRPVFIGIDRRSIPAQCQVHGTVRVDRLKLASPTSRPATVNLASDSPSFTQLWYPVAPSNRIQQAERITDANSYPLALSTFSAITNRKLPVQRVEQRPVTEFYTEKPSKNYDDDDDDDDDDIDDNADKEDDDGNVLSDFDDDDE